MTLDAAHQQAARDAEILYRAGKRVGELMMSLSGQRQRSGWGFQGPGSRALDAWWAQEVRRLRACEERLHQISTALVRASVPPPPVGPPPNAHGPLIVPLPVPLPIDDDPEYVARPFTNGKGPAYFPLDAPLDDSELS